jgi:histidinol-phosphate/aromatic aminotransferase/cobyric acid decarboxylase-like protein
LTPVQLAEHLDYDAAIDATASRLGVSRDSVLLTNGLDEGILVAAMVAFRHDANGQGIVVVPAFDSVRPCPAETRVDA